MCKVEYIIYNNKTGEELVYEDLKHAMSELKHKAMHEHSDFLHKSEDWELISHIS